MNRITLLWGACTVVHSETLADGGCLVTFTSGNDYSGLLKLDKLYANGYTATFIDTSTGFGTTVSDIGVSACDGIASVYSNNQGFVEELRVIVVDRDREFAIIVPQVRHRRLILIRLS